MLPKWGADQISHICGRFITPYAQGGRSLYVFKRSRYPESSCWILLLPRSAFHCPRLGYPNCMFDFSIIRWTTCPILLGECTLALTAGDKAWIGGAPHVLFA